MGRASPDLEKPQLPKRLASLARRLSGLSDEERRAVVEAASGEGSGSTVSWSSLEAASGIVNLGGNAVEDTEALYDG